MGIAILPTSCSSAANSSSWQLVLVHAELLRDAAGELDDRARVLGRVVVVVLDDVDQQHHGAAVGAVQLERRRLALAAIAREDREQPDERRDREQHERLVDGRVRGEEGDRRGSWPTRLVPRQLSTTSRTGLPCSSWSRLSAQAKSASAGGDEGEPGRRRRSSSDGGAGSEARRARAPDRWQNQESGMVVIQRSRCHSPRTNSGTIGEHGGERASSGTRLSGARKQQRDEDELLGRHVEVAVLEAHARDDRVADDQADDEQRVGVALVRDDAGRSRRQAPGRAAPTRCRPRARARPYAACDARAPPRRGARPASPAPSSSSGGSQRGRAGNAHVCGAKLHAAAAFAAASLEVAQMGRPAVGLRGPRLQRP